MFLPKGFPKKEAFFIPPSCGVCDSARFSCEYAHFQTISKISKTQCINNLKVWHGFCSNINKRTTKLSLNLKYDNTLFESCRAQPVEV